MEEINIAVERITRCVSFLTVDILMPALRVCRWMEQRATENWSVHLLVRDMERPIHSHLPVTNIHCRRLPQASQAHAKAWKKVVSHAHEISTLLLGKLAPGFSIWMDGCYGGFDDLFELLRNNRSQPTVSGVFTRLIVHIVQLLFGLRQSMRTEDCSDLDFEDFKSLMLNHFVKESVRNLVERVMNAPRRVWLLHALRYEPPAAEMLSSPQVMQTNKMFNTTHFTIIRHWCWWKQGYCANPDVK